MHDIEALAERVIVIGDGRILADGPFEALRAGVLAERRLFVDFAERGAGAGHGRGARWSPATGRQLELAFDPRPYARARR